MNRRLIMFGVILSILSPVCFLLDSLNPLFSSQNSQDNPLIFWKALTTIPAFLYGWFYFLYRKREKPSWFVTLYALVLAGLFELQMLGIIKFPAQGGFLPDYAFYMASFALLAFVLALGRFQVLLVTYLLPPLLTILVLFQTVDHFSRYLLFFLDRYKLTIFIMAVFLLATWSLDRLRTKEWFSREKVRNQQERNRQWTQLNRFKDEFLKNTSNELRAPVDEIIALSESMFRGSEEVALQDSRESLSLMISSGKRLNHLINDILDATKLKYERIALDLRSISLFPLVEETLALCAPLVGGRAVRLINHVDRQVPQVIGDEDRIKQVLLNLVGNAIKFTREGEITIQAKTGRELLRVTVSDTGEGISPGDQERIFNQFEQVDSSLSRNHEGAGLGLTITRQLIEMHGGTIRVESKQGVGSHFIFTLPLVSTSAPDTYSVREESTEQLPFTDSLVSEEPTKGVIKKSVDKKGGENGFHLLIVDDNPINLAVVENQLRPEGYRITRATGGAEALELLNHEKPDLILLDLMMPDMDGFQVCCEVRKKYKQSVLPIIYLVARSQEETLLNGFSLGGNDYLTKPFSKNLLLARVQTQLYALTSRKRFMMLHQFSKKIASFRTMRQLMISLVDTLAEDPFIQSVLLTHRGEILKQEGDIEGIIQPDIKKMEEFQPNIDDKGVAHIKLKDQSLLSVVLKEVKTEAWLRTVATQAKKSVESWQNQAFDPAATPAFSLIGSMLKDLLYIKSEGNYCHLYTLSEVREVRISMKRILSAFPDLMQVHRSYSVNTKAPVRLKKDKSSWYAQLYEHEIPVGRNWLPDVQERFS